MSKRVRYIGKRTMHADTLFKTGVCWQGEGDIQVIEDDDTAVEMARLCPLTYQIAAEVPAKGADPSDDASAEAEKAPGPLDTIMIEDGEDKYGDVITVPLRGASRYAIYKYAEEQMGMKLPRSYTRSEVLDAVVDIIYERENIEREKDELPHSVTMEDEFFQALVNAYVKAKLSEKPTVKFSRTLKFMSKHETFSSRAVRDCLNADVRDRAWDAAQEILKEKGEESNNVPELDGEAF